MFLFLNLGATSIYILVATMSQVVGFVLAGLSALCNGSFAALRKVEAVRHVSVTDIQFNLYLSLGVFLSSMVALLFIPAAGKDIGICWQGVLAGSLLAIAGLFSFLAVSALGLSVAQGNAFCANSFRVKATRRSQLL